MKFLVFVVLIVAAECSKLPPNFKKCNRKDDNFKTCLLDAARSGIKQLNRNYNILKMPNLEPLIIPRIDAQVDVPSINVTSTLENCKFVGLTEAEIDNFEFNFEQKTVRLDAVFPLLTSQCHYNIDGHILLAKVHGEGESSATFKKFKWSFNMTYEEVPRRGKTYVKPVSSHFDGKPESLSMNLDDLFGGDKQLGAQMNKLISDNWSELYDDVKITYLDNAKQTWLQIMNGWFTRVSLEDAFDS